MNFRIGHLDGTRGQNMSEVTIVELEFLNESNAIHVL